MPEEYKKPRGSVVRSTPAAERNLPMVLFIIAMTMLASGVVVLSSHPI